MKQIVENSALMAEIERIAEVAGYLWTRGWAERNGGNISVNVTTLLSAEELAQAEIQSPNPSRSSHRAKNQS